MTRAGLMPIADTVSKLLPLSRTYLEQFVGASAGGDGTGEALHAFRRTGEHGGADTPPWPAAVMHARPMQTRLSSCCRGQALSRTHGGRLCWWRRHLQGFVRISCTACSSGKRGDMDAQPRPTSPASVECARSTGRGLEPRRTPPRGQWPRSVTQLGSRAR